MTKMKICCQPFKDFMVDKSNRTMLHYVAFQDTLMNDGDGGNG